MYSFVPEVECCHNKNLKYTWVARKLAWRLDRWRSRLHTGKIFDKTDPDITQKTGQVYAESLALEERVGKQNISSNLQKGGWTQERTGWFSDKNATGMSETRGVENLEKLTASKNETVTNQIV